MTAAMTVAMVAYVVLWAAVATLFAIMGMTDVRTRRIPNELVAGVCAAWALMQAVSYVYGTIAGVSLAEAMAASGLPEPLLSLFSLPSAPVGLFTAVSVVVLLSGANALYERILRKEAMGAGDMKLIGAFALFLGPVPTLCCLMLACLFALVAAVPARMRTFPFAPALIMAFVCVFFIEL